MLEILLLDAGPPQRGAAICALLRASLSRLRIKLTYLPGDSRRRDATWQSAGIVMILGNPADDAGLPMPEASRQGKALLRIVDGSPVAAYHPASPQPPALDADWFSLGQLELPDDLAAAEPAIEACRLALRRAAIWVSCKRQRDESLALARIYADAPFAATAF